MTAAVAQLVHPLLRVENTGAVAVGDGHLFTMKDGQLAAYSAADGRPLWRQLLPTRSATDVVADSAASVVVAGSSRLTSHAETAGYDMTTGRRLWAKDGAVYSSTLSDGTVLTQSAQGYLALDPHTGKVRWRDAEGSCYPTTGQLLCTLNGTALSLRDQSSGQAVWTIADNGWDLMAIVHGTLYVNESDVAAGRSTLTALDARTGKTRWKVTLNAYSVVSAVAPIDAEHIGVSTDTVGGRQLLSVDVHNGSHTVFSTGGAADDNSSHEWETGVVEAQGHRFFVLSGPNTVQVLDAQGNPVAHLGHCPSPSVMGDTVACGGDNVVTLYSVERLAPRSDWHAEQFLASHLLGPLTLVHTRTTTFVFRTNT